MINISSSEIKKMDKIGSGNFGTAYLYKNKIYKVYHDKVVAIDQLFNTPESIPNPSLKYNALKYNYLKYVNSKLEYTDLIDDVLYIDGKFNGIVMPYYSGETFEDHKNDPLRKKVAMTRQLLLNARELTNNYIYPLDYKSNNMMLFGKKIQIIDLDDVKTPILNPIYKSKSIKVLDKAIKYFLGDVDYNCQILSDLFDKEYYPLNKTYTEIEKYLAEIIKENNYIFIYQNTDINKYLELLRNPKYRIVYVYDKMLEVEENVKYLLSQNIHIYYILPSSSLIDYLSSIAYDDLIDLKEQQIVKIKK